MSPVHLGSEVLVRGAESGSHTGDPALSHGQVLVVLGGLLLGVVLAALDQTIVATALPAVAEDIGGLRHMSWIVTAYMLAQTAAMPLFGRISDIRGRRPTFQVAIAIFLAGSLLSGIASSVQVLIAGRAVQGFGAGGLISLHWTIIGDIVSPRQRGRYQGYIAAVLGFASVAGPVVGGLIVDHLNWRWIFLVNLPIGVVAVLVAGFVLQLEFRRYSHHLDVGGALLLTGSVTLFLLVTVWGGTTFAWDSLPIVGALVMGSLFLVLLVRLEQRTEEPILAPALFANPTFRVATVVSVLAGMVLFGSIVFIPVYLQAVAGLGATESGALLAPFLVGYTGASGLSGWLIAATGRYRVYPAAGMGLASVGLWLLSGLDANSGMVTAAVAMVVMGIGVGMVVHVLVLAVQNAVPRDLLAMGTSVVYMFRYIGGAFGVSFFSAVITLRLRTYLPGRQIDLDVGLLELTGRPSLGTPPDEQVVDALARAIHDAFLWVVPLAIVGSLLALTLRQVPLRESAYVGDGTDTPTPPMSRG